MSSSFLVTLDDQAYDSKAAVKRDVTIITERLKQAGPTECTHAQLFEHVRLRKSFVCGAFETGCFKDDGKPKWGPFISQQIFAVDIDNSVEVFDEHGERVKGKKRRLRSYEEGFLDVDAALARCPGLELRTVGWYVTMSATLSPYWPKFRILFDSEEPVTDADEAKALTKYLLGVFPEADKACKNPNRIFFGSNGEVHDLSSYEWGGDS